MIDNPGCDIRHPEAADGRVDATWALIGEAGDYFLCDHHHDQVVEPDHWVPFRPEEWSRP